LKFSEERGETVLLLGDKVDAVVEPGKLGYFTSASSTGFAGLVLLKTAAA
jgi:hypothetical protein